MFDDQRLIEKYGSWFRAQNAFFQFVFKSAIESTAEPVRKPLIEAGLHGDYAEREDGLETLIMLIEHIFPSSESAWTAFLKKEGIPT